MNPGLDRGFITSVPAAGATVQRTRAPFTDEVAGCWLMRPAWGELARYDDPHHPAAAGHPGGHQRHRTPRPALRAPAWTAWDQKRSSSMFCTTRPRSATTTRRCVSPNGSTRCWRNASTRPWPSSRSATACPPPWANAGRWRCSAWTSTTWVMPVSAGALPGVHLGLRGMDLLPLHRLEDAGPGRYSPALTRVLEAGDSMPYVRRYWASISERITEWGIDLAEAIFGDVLQQAWVACRAPPAPASRSPGWPSARLRPWRSRCFCPVAAPAEACLLHFEPALDGGACPRNPDRHTCDKFVLSGAALLVAQALGMAVARPSSSGRRNRRLPARLLRADRPRDHRPGRRPAPGLGSSMTHSPWKMAQAPGSSSTWRILPVAPPSALPTWPPQPTTSRTGRWHEQRVCAGAPKRPGRARLRSTDALAVSRDPTRSPGSLGVQGQRRRGYAAAWPARVPDLPRRQPDARAAVAAAIAQAGEQRSRILDAQDGEREATLREWALNAEDALKAAHNEILAQRTRIGELLGPGQGPAVRMDPGGHPADHHHEHHAQAIQRVRALTAVQLHPQQPRAARKIFRHTRTTATSPTSKHSSPRRKKAPQQHPRRQLVKALPRLAAHPGWKLTAHPG